MSKSKIKPINIGYINPYKKKELKYWAAKWKISWHQLRDVLDVTGSSRVDFIEKYLFNIKLIS